MEEGTVVPLPKPGATLADDPLLAVLREGARRMLMQAVEAEVEAFLVAHADLADGQGRRRLVRNGHAPERHIQTGIGPVAVSRPRVRDRGDGASAPIRFTSAILPPYLRRARNVEELLPWLYLKGVSTGQFGEALAALLGSEAPGLSAATVRRLTEAWQEEHARWQRRDLSARRYVYLWADGVYFTPRLEHERQCLLVLIGADAQRPQGAAGGRGRLPRERPELARAAAPAARRERARPRPRARHRRRRPWLLAGAARGLAEDAAAKMLGAQDRQRPERPAQVGRTARPSRTCTPSTRPRTAPRPRRPSTASSPSTGPSTTRPQPAWPRTARRCSPSTRCRPSTGSTSGRPTRSRAPSPRSGCAPTRRRAACRGRPRWRWSSSSPSRPSGTGGGWTAPSGLAQVIAGVRFRDGEPVQADRGASRRLTLIPQD